MRPLVLAGLLLLPLLAGTASAHDPNTKSIILRDGWAQPDSAQLIVNDSILFHHADGRENVSHNISVDFDGDGIVDASQVIVGECDWDADPDCRVAWTFDTTNRSDLVGRHAFIDIDSNGTVVTIWVDIAIDAHPLEGGPGIGECFGAGCDEEEPPGVEVEGGQTDLQKGMLLLGMMMFGGAGVLAVAMVMERQ